MNRNVLEGAGPEVRPRIVFLEMEDAELKRAWATFPDPVALHQGESWQYMGTVPREEGGGWEHQFRHRADPATGERKYLRILAPERWQPPGNPVVPVPVPPRPVPVCEPAVSSPNRPNRYSGTCAACGGSVPAYSGTISKAGGRWVVWHAACVGKAVAVAPRSGAGRSRVKRGMCEDAPCCGCCGPQWGEGGGW